MVRQGVLGLLAPGQVVKVEMPHDILVLGGGGGGHYNRGNKGGDGGSGVVIIKYLRSLGRTTFSPTNTNNISSRKETKHSLNRSLIFHIDPSHPKPHEIAHILLVAGGGGGGMDMGGGGGGGGVISYTSYPINFLTDQLQISLGGGGGTTGQYALNPPPGGSGGESRITNLTTRWRYSKSRRWWRWWIRSLY